VLFGLDDDDDIKNKSFVLNSIEEGDSNVIIEGFDGSIWKFDSLHSSSCICVVDVYLLL
jgi:hypothetical protein